MDRNKGEDDPFFFSDENALDFGDIPDDMPKLTQIEEMIIARVHVHVQIFQYRGQQYHYRGHCINFLRDVGSVCTQLPLLPKDLDVIILRPSNATSQPHMVRQFQQQFRVRRAVIERWLKFLLINHPGYAGIIINSETLSQLPDDGDVEDHFLQQRIDEIDFDKPLVSARDQGEGQAQYDDQYLQVEVDTYDQAAVPDLIAERADLEQFRRHLNQQSDSFDRTPLEQAQQQHLEMPGIRSTPLSEFNRSQALLSLAFPSLYPYGKADFIHPRARSVTYDKYIEHAMKHKSGRFAMHSRFRYVVFNTLMRHQVNSRSTYFVKRNRDRTIPLDVNKIRAAFKHDTPEGQALLSSIVKLSGSLRGTRPFWGSRRTQLEAQVYALACPSLFFTLSAANTHWESLQKHFPRYQEWLQADHRQKINIASANLRDNPHIAAYHFHRRFTSFLKQVLVKKFNITDYWYRYEWQSRGSTHVHGVCWVNGSPVDLSNVLAQKEFADYWGQYISAFNPEPRLAVNYGPGDPLLSYDQQQPSFETLRDVVNRVQRHRCTELYCQRRLRLPNGKLSPQKVCRFHYPRAHHDSLLVSQHLSRQYLMFDGSRNDAFLNHYSRLMALGWLANHDIAPCTSKQAVINYIGKYVTKAEVKSESYKETARALLPRVDEQQGFAILLLVS